MNLSVPLSVCVGKGGQADAAASFAKRLDIPLAAKPGEGLTVLYDAAGVSLLGYGLTFRGDFEEQMLHRVTDGRLQHEMLVHTAKTKEEPGTAVDATAGMGEDSFLLAAAGYTVTLFEQNPVIAVLLKDALRRAKKNPALREIAERMRFIEGDSITLLPTLPSPDLIYLDPMFPARQKSGLINKKLQLIQKLELPCGEEEALLSAAIAAAPKKIIIKRPLKGAYLAGKKPDYSIEGKAIRYDCLVFPKA